MDILDKMVEDFNNDTFIDECCVKGDYLCKDCEFKKDCEYCEEDCVSCEHLSCKYYFVDFSEGKK